ncbi:MAG: HupE/UreJ family protein [Paracoccus sp. (in: a-proteobacteria)]|jgi:urease accessory protein|uniref:HupE/UreJ family protein n=1 Tax=unclassified Paracoccus (in: a-proteobacteria) TaxID=2688777 RepID=UPI000C3F97F7|nr:MULTISPECIES: HupE/UreJ family protein [unclassified Paracoccus (in: a-proteobacteria)]MAN56516.1 urease accessory protein [Paracoccus sp. (in: a-proteobacteria)]|tara:strand:+ start:12156 stop:12716 length:561 start_codon:yes stop_codon:yes gene_type:complete
MTRFLIIAATLLVPRTALAHGGGDQGRFLGGLIHPVSGADHMLAMIAVGLLAAQIGGRALLALPLSFVGAMVAGGVAGHAGFGFPGVEPMILASVVVLVALVAMAARPPLAVLLPGAALFGFTHGWAHGAEAPAEGLIAYAAGFALMTSALHLAGIQAGRLIRTGALLRGLGGGTAVAGLMLAFGV